MREAIKMAWLFLAAAAGCLIYALMEKRAREQSYSSFIERENSRLEEENWKLRYPEKENESKD